MQIALDQFLENLAQARNLGAIYNTFSRQTTPVLDLTDVLRAEILLAVSAFDNFIHELTRIGMVETFDNHRPPTDAYMRFQVSLDSAHSALSSPNSNDWLDEEIRKQHSRRSFQRSDNVADAIRLISPLPLSQAIGQEIGEDQQILRNRLDLIVDRRNKIAHEADVDPLSPGSRWPITTPLVEESVDLLQRIGQTIFALL